MEKPYLEVKRRTVPQVVAKNIYRLSSIYMANLIFKEYNLL